MTMKLKKVASKLLTKQARHASRWSRGHASNVRQGTQGMLVCEHMSSQATLTRVSTQVMLTCETCKHSRHVGTSAHKGVRYVGTWARITEDTLDHKHVSTKDTLVREHVSTQGTLAREHLSMQDTFAREHVSMQDTLSRDQETRE